MLTALALATALAFSPPLPVDKAAHAGVGVVMTQLCVRGIQGVQVAMDVPQVDRAPLARAIFCTALSSGISAIKENLDKYPDNKDWYAGTAGAVLGAMLVWEW